MRRKRKPNIVERVFYDAYKFVFGGCLLVVILIGLTFFAVLVYTAIYSNEILTDVKSRHGIKETGTTAR